MNFDFLTSHAFSTGIIRIAITGLQNPDCISFWWIAPGFEIHFKIRIWLRIGLHHASDFCNPIRICSPFFHCTIKCQLSYLFHRRHRSFRHSSTAQRGLIRSPRVWPMVKLELRDKTGILANGHDERKLMTPDFKVFYHLVTSQAIENGLELEHCLLPTSFERN